MKPSGESPGLRTFLVTVTALLQQWRLVLAMPLACMAVAGIGNDHRVRVVGCLERSCRLPMAQLD